VQEVEIVVFYNVRDQVKAQSPRLIIFGNGGRLYNGLRHYIGSFYTLVERLADVVMQSELREGIMRTL
jgi:hypothetical protein